MQMPRTKDPVIKRICISCKNPFIYNKKRPNTKTCGTEECIAKARSNAGKSANEHLKKQSGSVDPHSLDTQQYNIILPKISKNRQQELDKEKEADEMRIKYYKMMGRLR